MVYQEPREVHRELQVAEGSVVLPARILLGSRDPLTRGHRVERFGSLVAGEHFGDRLELNAAVGADVIAPTAFQDSSAGQTPPFQTRLGHQHMLLMHPTKSSRSTELAVRCKVSPVNRATQARRPREHALSWYRWEGGCLAFPRDSPLVTCRHRLGIARPRVAPRQLRTGPSGSL
jgi:hypothetical protein